MNVRKIGCIFSVILACVALFSSCATLVGGSSYNAHVIINNDHPKAQIIYQGEVKGYGTAIFKVPRVQANNFSFIVKEDGCPEQTYSYKFRTFRAEAFVGSIILSVGSIPLGVPVPYGPIIDFASGAIWKPNVHEAGISQESIKTFKYLVNYDCSSNNSDSIVSDYIDVIYLKNGNLFRGIIVEQVPNVQIKLRAIGGSNLVFPYRDIDRMVKEPFIAKKVQVKPELIQETITQKMQTNESAVTIPVVEAPAPVVGIGASVVTPSKIAVRKTAGVVRKPGVAVKKPGVAARKPGTAVKKAGTAKRK